MFNDATGIEFIDTETILNIWAMMDIELHFMVSSPASLRCVLEEEH